MADKISIRCGFGFLLVSVLCSVGWAFRAEQPPSTTRTLKDRGIIIAGGEVGLGSSAQPAGIAGTTKRAPTAKAVSAWRRFTERNGSRWCVRWNYATKTAHWVTTGPSPMPMIGKLTSGDIESACRGFIGDNVDLLGADDSQLLLSNKAKAGGRWSVAFRQIYKGIPVLGGQVRMLFTPDDGLMAFGSDIYPDVDIGTQPKMSSEEAIEAAQANCLDTAGSDEITEPKLVIVPLYRPQKFEYLLCWQLEIFQPMIQKNWRYLVDADTGAVVGKSNTLVYDNITGTIRGQYKREFASDAIEIAPFPHESITASAPEIVIAKWDFDTDPGWSTEGDWSFGVPAGHEGIISSDPNSGFTGENVYGYNLYGNYHNYMPVYYLRTTSIDCSGYDNVHLGFMRWLGVESSRFDNASIEVSNDGNNWTTVWANPNSALSDTYWVRVMYDISEVAAFNSAVYIRWAMGPTDLSVTYAGWNIDDVAIVSFANPPSTAETDTDGFYSVPVPWNRCDLKSELKGLYCDINYACGPDSVFERSDVYDGEVVDFIWDDSLTNELVESNVYHHINYVHDYFTALDPNLSDPSAGYPSGLDYSMPVRVQAGCSDGYCNAYWNGKGITFGAGDGVYCDDFGLYSEVIYHEYTHGVTSKVYDGVYLPYAFEAGAMNEGWSDYFAGLLSASQSPLMGDGGLVISNPDGFRTLDNDYRRETDFYNEVHVDSQMFSGALWDARNMMDRHGDAEILDGIVHFARYSHPETFEECLGAILFEDDVRYGDGYLGNGTPHGQAIYTAFGNHGIGGLQYLAPSIVIDDATGNGDGKLDPGETANLSLSLTNGWADATGVSARFSSSDPLLKINKRNGNFPNVEHGDVTTNQYDPFVVRLDAACPRTHSINLTLDVSASGPYNYSRTCLLTYPVAVQQFVYDDGQSDATIGYGKGGGGGLAIRITPSKYPCYISHVNFLPHPDSNATVTLKLWDDDGPSGSPGTVLGSIDAHIVGNGGDWRDVDVSSLNIRIDDGSFYAGWVQGYTAYFNGFDMDPPYYNRTWVYSTLLQGWAPLVNFGYLGNLMVRVRYLYDLGGGPVQNIFIGKRYAAIQEAIDEAYAGDEIVAEPQRYYENVRLAGKNLTLRSTNPDDPAVVAATIIDGNNNGPTVLLSDGIDATCALRGFTITAGKQTPDDRGGISCIKLGETGPTISKCVIRGNFGSGIYCKNSSPTIRHCAVLANQGAGIELVSASSPTIENCTIANNLQHGIAAGYASVTNSIICDNMPPQIKGSALVSYSDIEGDWPGLGNIDADPCFVDPNIGDYRLKSQGWRWDRDTSQWTWDEVTSRCIDAGNPGAGPRDEALTLDVDPLNRVGRNLRINMGAYGGTTQASMPPYDWTLLGDLTNDGTTDFIDLMHWAQNWLTWGQDMPGDLDRNGFVNMSDFAGLAEGWALQTSWHQ